MMKYYVCGVKHEKDDDCTQVQVPWLGMWLHGAAPNLCWGGQTPRGSDCGSCVSKNRQPPSPPPLFFTADADLCLSSEGSNYWVRGKDAPPFNKPTSNHPMTDGLGVWLTCWTEVKRFNDDKEKTELEVLTEAETCSQDRASGTRHPPLSSPFISLLINSISLLHWSTVTWLQSLSVWLYDSYPLSYVSSASYIRLTW